MLMNDDTMPLATEDEWAQECARRVLLTHLGLTPLISRFDPEGAKLAHRLIAPDDSKVYPEEATVDVRGVAVETAQSVRALLTDPQFTEDRFNAEVESGSAGSAPVADTTERVSLIVVTTADLIWLEVLEDGLLRQEQLHLIVAMARAVRGHAVSSAHQQFDWPPENGLAFGVPAGGMQDMLSGFLRRLISDHDTRFLIRLGDIALLPSIPLEVRDLPSTMTMLRDPASKRVAWSELRSLPTRA